MRAILAAALLFACGSLSAQELPKPAEGWEERLSVQQLSAVRDDYVNRAFVPISVIPPDEVKRSTYHWHTPYTGMLNTAVGVLFYLPKKMVPNRMIYADSIHENLAERFVTFAEGMDKLMSRRRDPRENRSQFNLTMAATFSRKDTPDISPSVGCQLDLPRTSGRLQLVVDHVTNEFKQRVDRQESIDDAQDRIAQGRPAGGGTSIGLRYIHRISKFIEQHFDAGITYKLQFNNLTKPPTPYVRTSLGTAWKKKIWGGRAFAQSAWNGVGRLENTAGLYMDRPLSYDMALSLASNLSWNTDNADVAFYQTVSFPIAVGEDDSLTPAIQFSANSYPAVVSTAYGFSLGYRHNLYEKWVFFSTIPGLEFSRDYGFKTNPKLTLRMDIYFGGTTVRDERKEEIPQLGKGQRNPVTEPAVKGVPPQTAQ